MNFVTLLLPLFSSLIERIFPDKAKQDEAKLELAKVANEALTIQMKAQSDMMASQSAVVVAEASSESWMARNWRPMLMWMFMALIFNQYFINPIVAAFGFPLIFPPIPEHGWTMLDIGMGGYIVGRSAEKIAHSFNKAKFESTLKEQGIIMSPSTSVAIDKAVADALKAENN